MSRAVRRRGERARELPFAYRAAIRTVRPLMLGLTRRDWHGADNLPATGGCVIAANHISHADPFAVAHFLYDNGRPPYFLGKASLFELPLVGRWLSACEQVPVHRGDGRAAEAFQAAVEAVEQGKCIVVMPESTITKDPLGWPMAGKTGAARIALKVGVPVLPLGQWGAQELLSPQGRFRPWARPRMRMRLGPPVALDDLRAKPMDATTLRAATGRIMGDITAQVAQLRGEPAPAGVWNQTLGRRVRLDSEGLAG